MKLNLNQRYLLALLVFLIAWGGAYLLYQQASNDEIKRETVDTLLKNAEQISSSDLELIGDLSDLSGNIVFIEQRTQPDYRVAQLDLNSGEIETLFTIPSGALVYQIATGFDSSTLLLSYSAPATADQSPFDRNGIYELDTASSELTRLIGDDVADMYYAYQQASEDAIYYATYSRLDNIPRIYRYDRATGHITHIADSATLPMLSLDGQSITYLLLNPTTENRSLWIANALDGSHARELIAENTYPDIDLPMFSEDGEWIYFTVLEPAEEASLTTFDVMLGVYPVRAHGDHVVPATWYRISITGGTAEQVSIVPAVILYGGVNGESIGFVNPTGFYIAMGTRLQQIVRSQAIRSFVWLP